MQYALILLISIVKIFSTPVRDSLSLTYQSYNDLLYIKIHFSRQLMYTNFRINQSSSITWTSNDIYEEEKSPFMKILKKSAWLNLSYLQVHAKQVSDHIDMIGEKNNVSLSNFPFYIVEFNQLPHFFPVSIGLLFQFNSYNESLVHNLYYKNIIQKLSYAFIPDQERRKEKGQFIIGKITEENTQNYPYKSYCNVSESSPYWTCKLAKVNDYESEAFARFDVSVKEIVVPSKFVQYLLKEDKTFKEDLKNNKCALLETPVVRFKIVCKSKNLPKLTFEFSEGNGLTIGLEEMSFCMNEICEAEFDINRDSETEFKIGYSVLRNVISVFDYEEKKVSFYSKNNKYKDRERKLMLIITIINTVICIGAVVLISQNIKRNNIF